MMPWIDALLPTDCTEAFSKIDIEKTNPAFEGMFKKVALEMKSGQLPKSLHARKVASHTVDPRDEQSVRCDIWLIRSVPKRSLFSP